MLRIHTALIAAALLFIASSTPVFASVADGSAVNAPAMRFSTYLGGTGFDQAYNVAVDSAGNAYVVGVAYTDDFPTTPGAFQTDRTGTDGFVTKLSADGSTILWSTYLRGANCQGVAVDSSGNVYVTGYASINFPTTAGAFDTSLNGGFDAFVTKFSPDGSTLVYSTLIGGSFDDFAYDIALDAAGNAYITGNTAFPAPGPGDFPTVNAFQPAFGGGNEDAFVTKLNAAGSALVYSTYLGGGAILNSTDDWGEGIAVDAAGSAYVTGYTFSPDFPTTAGAFDRDWNGLDAFVTKFSPSGSAIVYSTYLGGTRRDQGLDIAVNTSGNAFVTGLTESLDNFPTTPGAFQTTGSFDAFVTKLNPQGSGLVYSTYLGGECGVDRAWGIAIDAAGNAYVAGDTGSQSVFCQGDFPELNAVQPAYGGGLTDAFAAKLNASGTALVYSTHLGGNLFDEARAIAFSPNGSSAYVVGSTSSFDFAATPNAAQQQNAGGIEHHDDAIVVKISEAAPTAGADTPGVTMQSSNGWFLRNSNSSGAADVVFGFGPGTPDVVTLAGDWNGDGLDTAGLYSPTTGTFFLKNVNGPGAADMSFQFGPGGLGWAPLAGDWNGDGIDTIGVYDPATGNYFLRNTNSPGAANLTFQFGAGGAGAVPVAGDFDGNGSDTIGFYVPSTGVFFLRNSNSPGPANMTFQFGVGGATPIVGDFDGNGTDSVGLYVPQSGAFFLRNSNTSGPADVVFSYGAPNLTPHMGDWDGQ